MLISQPISRCLTNHSELCMSSLLNNQARRIPVYRLQRRPSFGFESSVSSIPMTSSDPVVGTDRRFRLLVYDFLFLLGIQLRKSFQLQGEASPPNPLTRGSAPGPCWGLRPRPPVHPFASVEIKSWLRPWSDIYTRYLRPKILDIFYTFNVFSIYV